MKCPNCNVNLLMTDRNGVEIDYCPDCRGVWLDRGELDKIIEISAVKVQNNQVVDRYNTFVNPNQPLSMLTTAGLAKSTAACWP